MGDAALDRILQTINGEARAQPMTVEREVQACVNVEILVQPQTQVRDYLPQDSGRPWSSRWEPVAEVENTEEDLGPALVTQIRKIMIRLHAKT